MDLALGVPLTWPDLGEGAGSACSNQNSDHSHPWEASVLSPRPGWSLGCLSGVFDPPGLGRGTVGRVLSTSSALSLQPPPTGPMWEVWSPNQHHANSDRWMYIFWGSGWEGGF